jgi:hypothetical protein
MRLLFVCEGVLIFAFEEFKHVGLEGDVCDRIYVLHHLLSFIYYSLVLNTLRIILNKY